jgi:hypothetical protein
MFFGLNDVGFLAAVSGGSALWTPADITTALWLDAADASTVTTDGGAVSEWRDKSGNNRNATASGSARPTYDATRFNGKATIDFSTSNQLDLVSFAQISGQTIIAVADTSNLGASDRVFLNRSNGAVDNLALYLGTSGRDYAPGVYWAARRALWVSAVRAKAIVRWSFFSGTPASALTQVNAEVPVTETFTASQLTNWNAINNKTVQQSDIDLSELIVTPPGLSSLNLDKLHGYLAHKWGLTANLPNDHPYKTSAPTA